MSATGISMAARVWGGPLPLILILPDRAVIWGIEACVFPWGPPIASNHQEPESRGGGAMEEKTLQVAASHLNIRSALEDDLPQEYAISGAVQAASALVTHCGLD
ncbi:hypothetical protein AAFF_G00282160 [Aldrovandia affinis]|uniref:Uncharacterized protein n=1 Tax=Aldrovandia affinis TaxID=143900 RepID=A0AAD7T9Q4_9TELE|nr:hypothetical protein AAFF_G00282160 [Aldrovandia affinis]